MEIAKLIAVTIQIFEKIMFSAGLNILTSDFQPAHFPYSSKFEVIANVGALDSIGFEAIVPQSYW